MAVAMMLDNPDGSQELYEKLRARLRLDAPAGGTVHLAGPRPRGGRPAIDSTAWVAPTAVVSGRVASCTSGRPLDDQQPSCCWRP